MRNSYILLIEFSLHFDMRSYTKFKKQHYKQLWNTMTLHVMISLIPETWKSCWLYMEDKCPTLVFQQLFCDVGDSN